mmetsp:Transcript_118/g.254  ORF Transcript_118/g.254 Transcript_118/m.254 type:complete len:388 (+) Transcript_118:45-1208(+)
MVTWRMEQAAFVILLCIARAELQVADASTEDSQDCDTVFLQTSFNVSNLSPSLRLTAVHKENASTSLSKFLSLMSLEVRNNSSSTSNIAVMLLVATAMVIIIPLIVYLLSDSGSYDAGSGAKLLSKGELRLSSKREVPPTTGPRGSEQRMSLEAVQQRMSLEAVQAVPPTGYARPQPDQDPPLLCENLILPKHLSIFLVDTSRLRTPALGPFPVWGGSGKQLLEATLQDQGPEGVQLWIWPVNMEFPAAVVLQRRSGMQTGLEIYNRDSQFYGFLEYAGGRVMLMCNGFPVMAVDGNADELSYTACRIDGSVLAWANVVTDNVRVDDVREAWKLHVRPGVDAIVIMCAFLSSILLKNRRSGTFTPSLPPASPRVSILSSASGLPPRG